MKQRRHHASCFTACFQTCNVDFETPNGCVLQAAVRQTSFKCDHRRQIVVRARGPLPGSRTKVGLAVRPVLPDPVGETSKRVGKNKPQKRQQTGKKKKKKGKRADKANLQECHFFLTNQSKSRTGETSDISFININGTGETNPGAFSGGLFPGLKKSPKYKCEVEYRRNMKS